MDPVATRRSWKTLPMPERKARLAFEASLGEEDFSRLRRGLAPKVMEDKWFIFMEGDWLFFHRSWTGFCLFQVRWERVPATKNFRAAEAWVNRDPEQYTETDLNQDAALLNWLIKELLLEQVVPAPM